MNHQCKFFGLGFSRVLCAFGLAGVAGVSSLEGKSGVDSVVTGVGGFSEESGVRPYVRVVGEVFHNHRGGVRNGSDFSGLLDVGVEFDLEKLAGWKGASIFANAFYFDGGDFSGSRVGDFNAVTNLYTDTSFNFYNIFFQQSFWGGDSFFKLGQIALDDDFMVSESALLFLNAGFGPMPVQSGNTGAPVYALAAPGGVFRFDLDGPGFAQVGVYAGDSGSAVSGNQGFGWNTGGVSGWMVIGEAGFTYGKDGASVVKVGGYYHSGEYERFADGVKESGLYSFYFVVDHQLVSGVGGPSLNVFLRGGVAPQDEIAAVGSYVEGGLVSRGVFKEDDALGLSASWTCLTDGFLPAEGGRSSETVLELTYQIPVCDRFTLQPDVQYVIDPQEGGGNALVTGIRAELSF